jgi:hypothetical protein
MKFLAGRSQDIADISRMLEDLESLIILGKLEYS